VRALAREGIACTVVQVGGQPANGAWPIEDSEGLAARRYDARPGTCYLLRPDQHVCARWRAFELGAVRAAIARATAHTAEAAKATKAAA
jgi:3-(3-hydroxy-phenyl)propionate hydroxylase